MTSPITPELQAKIAEWRHKATTNEISLDEMKEAIRVMREGRLKAASAAAKSSAGKSKRTAASEDALLDELGGL